MTLKQLKHAVDETLKQTGDREIKVGIPNGKPYIGRTSITEVNTVSMGFDWDSNTFFVIPEHKMKEE